MTDQALHCSRCGAEGSTVEPNSLVSGHGEEFDRLCGQCRESILRERATQNQRAIK